VLFFFLVGPFVEHYIQFFYCVSCVVLQIYHGFSTRHFPSCSLVILARMGYIRRNVNLRFSYEKKV